jgi:ankyrin repeat protein
MTLSLRRLMASATLMAGAFSVSAATDTALINAAKRGDTAGVRALLAKKADVNAAGVDNLEIVNLLIDAGANVNAETRYKITPMSLACTNGNAAIIERLLKAGVDANSTSEEGQTALMTAALNGKVDAIKMLLTHGAKVNATEPYKGQTALMWAAGEGNVDAAALLIEFGGDVKVKSKAGFTPLLFAVMNNQIPAVKVLVEHGANVDDRAIDGSTTLNMAIINAYYDMASVLLDLGANPNVQDLNGTPLHSLVWMRKPGTSWEAAATATDPITVPRPSGQRMTDLQLAKKLLEKGADPNVKIAWKEMKMDKGLGTTKNPPNINLGRHYMSFVGSTPFYNAARNGDPAMMKLLVEHGADPKLATPLGITPLMAAACLDYYEGETPGPLTGVSEAERLEAVKLAVELGNDLNARTHLGDYPLVGTSESMLAHYPDNFNDLADLGTGDARWDGFTALHGAVLCNQPSILQYLLDKGADPTIKSRLGWTPYTLTQGIFMANSKKEFPVAAQILKKAMAEKGQTVASRE